MGGCTARARLPRGFVQSCRLQSLFSSIQHKRQDASKGRECACSQQGLAPTRNWTGTPVPGEINSAILAAQPHCPVPCLAVTKHPVETSRRGAASIAPRPHHRATRRSSDRVSHPDSRSTPGHQTRATTKTYPEPNRQSSSRVEKEARHRNQLTRIHSKRSPRIPSKESRQSHIRLQPSQTSTEADVRPATKGEMHRRRSNGHPNSVSRPRREHPTGRHPGGEDNRTGGRRPPTSSVPTTPDNQTRATRVVHRRNPSPTTLPA